MRKKRLYKITVLAVAAVMACQTVQGQSLVYSDPGRIAAMNKAERMMRGSLEAYIAEDVLLISGNIALKESLEDLINVREEWEKYLRKRHDYVAIGANAFAIMLELDKLYKNVTNLIEATAATGNLNAIAVGLSPRNHTIYTNIFNTTVAMVVDLKEALGRKKDAGNNDKEHSFRMMTEKEYLELTIRTRDHLRKHNVVLRRAERKIRAFSFVTLWDEIAYRRKRFDKQDRKDRLGECLTNWKHSGLKGSNLQHLIIQ